MTVRFSVDDDAMQRRFDELDNLRPAITAAEQVLVRQYQGAQHAVHVITGSLKGSEKIGSVMTGDRWEGEIAFGGTSAGFPNDPVDYAVYEAARGGRHDFTAPITALSGQYRRIMLEHLRGRA